MKLKTRLIISFCTIIFVPIILVTLAFIGFRQQQMNELKEQYGIEATDYSYLVNSVQLKNRYTQEDYEKLSELAKDDVKKLTDVDYLTKYSNGLEEKNSYLIVREDQKLLYDGDKKGGITEEELPDYGNSTVTSDIGIYIDGNAHVLLKQIDFLSENKTKCSLYIITDLDKTSPEIKSIFADMVISVILILIFTAVMLAAWLYRGILTPINKLEEATKNIKEGNLDFTLESEGKDEIGELCQNFEEMRQRLKEYTEERVNNEKENRILISNISHDLKTPITAIKGYAEGIIDGVADSPEKRDRYIRTIYNKTLDMTRLVNELTLYAQIDTNRIPYNFQKLNVSDYFNDCVEELTMDLEEKHVLLQYMDYAADDILIIADPEQLKRVINNVVNNTVKYLDKPSGIINMRIKDVGDFIQVEIEDNGRGISAQDLPYIFDRFYRTDASRNSSTGGSGIGLSIVKKIIEDHGGKIWATSKLGTGTVMYFVIRKYQEVVNE